MAVIQLWMDKEARSLDPALFFQKAEQLAATGAKYVIAPCANCKKQLREVIEDHQIEMEVVGLHDLLYKAIVID